MQTKPGIYKHHDSMSPFINVCLLFVIFENNLFPELKTLVLDCRLRKRGDQASRDPQFKSFQL